MTSDAFSVMVKDPGADDWSEMTITDEDIMDAVAVADVGITQAQAKAAAAHLNRLSTTAFKWRSRAFRAEDNLGKAVRGLERIANPNWATQATAQDARDMAGYARLILDEIHQTNVRKVAATDLDQ